MGAWIETVVFVLEAGFMTSRPAWARGLKLCLFVFIRKILVAPRVGAWIETIIELIKNNPLESRPAWARGLKPLIWVLWVMWICRAPRGRVD